MFNIKNIAAIVVFWLVMSMNATACTSGSPSTNCPQYSAGQPPLSSSTGTDVQESSNPGLDYPVETAINAVNSAASENGSNSQLLGTITVTASAPTNPSTPTVYINWDTTTTNTITSAICGFQPGIAGCSRGPAYTNNANLCVVTIYLYKFDPLNTGYGVAIARAVSHEISHCVFGIGDAIKPISTGNPDYATQYDNWQHSLMSPCINGCYHQQPTASTNCDIPAETSVINEHASGNTCAVPQ